MSSTTLYRLSGGVLLVGGLFIIIGFLLHPGPGSNNLANYLSPIWLPSNLLIIMGALLTALGLPATYTRQAENAGKLGLIGFTLTFFVLLLFNVALGAIETLLFPALAAHVATSSFLSGAMPAPYSRFVLIALLFELVGPLLFGIATLRAKVFPSWTGWLLIATPVFALAGFFVSLPGPLAQIDALVLTLALVGMGISLLRRQRTTQSQAAVSSSSL